MAGSPIWYELMTPDAMAVAPFYRETLGWEIAEPGNILPNGSEYRTIARRDGGAAGGVLTLSPGMVESGVPASWISYFHVEDLDDALARAQAEGARLWMGAQEVPGAGRMAMSMPIVAAR